MKRGVPVRKAHVTRLLGGSGPGHAPQGKFWISDLLRSFLVYSWGKIPDLLLNLVMFGGRRIKGVPPLRAAKQPVISVRRGKISAPILIAYRHL